LGLLRHEKLTPSTISYAGSVCREGVRRSFDSEAVESKWLERWQSAGVYEARRGRPGDKKFFLHFAYPGISGFLHVGHLRGFSYSDVFCRYRRMTGHHVLFPAGFHASGIPSVGLARKVERGDPATLEYLRSNGTPEDVIPRLKDPKFVVEYFGRVYAEDYWRRFGYLIDWRTLCTTIDPGYNRFIQWQFRRLERKGLLTVKPHHGPHCPLDGAVAVDASETDISKGGQAEINEYTLLKFALPDGAILPCATLRPETVYGVTNLWIRPDGPYVRVRVGNETWVVSTLAAEKLRGQREDVAPTAENVSSAAVIGQSATNPFTGAQVPVLPAPFVDPGRATGVVMSVPAHAPYDWQALHEIRPDLQPIVIIRHPKAQGVPAEEAVRKHGVKSQADQAALDAATEEVYADEFHGGEMLPNTNRLAGLKVSEAKAEIKSILEQIGQHATFQDFSEDVVCRCGRPVYVRRIPDQWFVKYSDAALTDESKRHAQTMTIFPAEYQRDMPAVLDWFGDRACIRKGSWLGTEFPFKPGWIIEPISDSTFYPAYYIVSPYVAAGQLKPEDLTDAFFDHVFLGEGRPLTPVWGEVRQDFDYWYPVDINLGGKEHKTVHFPPYVMNHVALLEGPNAAKRPKGIFVNWWVTQKAGQKISKSKGGAEPIPNAAKKYSVDGMRLYYCHVSSAHVDLEWDPDIVLDYRARVARIFQFVADLADSAAGASPAGVDEWLREAWASRLRVAREAFDAYDLRTACNQLYFEFYNDLQWWVRRGGARSPGAQAVVDDWVRSLGPVTPFLAEELHEVLGGARLVAASDFPETTAAAGPDGARAREEYLRAVLDDIHSIVRVTQIKPKRIVVHTAPRWKLRAQEAVLEAARAGQRNPGDVIKRLLADPDLKPHGKDIPAFVQRAMKDATGRSDEVRGALDEFEVLAQARDFLARELESAVEVYRADDAAAPDPGKKRNVAAPRKPALYVE
jgi:leucyl-tRNA synthetase